ncbi:MAG TPA: hypothetical protein VGN97_12230 [Mesorhizobium sp.]|jgi:hypothetical protein|nr:hypothetical protein [Mesorhizobium sp.]
MLALGVPVHAQSGIPALPGTSTAERAITDCQEVQATFEREMAQVDLFRPSIAPNFKVQSYPFWRLSGLLDCIEREFDALQTCIESHDFSAADASYAIRETKAKFSGVLTAYLHATRPGSEERLKPLIDEALEGAEEILATGEFSEEYHVKTAQAPFGVGEWVHVWISMSAADLAFCVGNVRSSY